MKNMGSKNDMKVRVAFEMDNEPSAMDSEIYDNGQISVIQEYRKDEPYRNNCWHRFLRRIRSFWATKFTENVEEDKNLFINTTLRELIIYITFLAILVIIAFGMKSGAMYWFTNLLSNLFLTNQFSDNSGSFSSMNGNTDLWKFLTGPLLNGLYWNKWYNDANMSSDENNFIFYENKLIGVPRIRQVRVANNSCMMPVQFKNVITDCYATYSSSSESRKPFGLETHPAWTYTEQSVLGSDTFQGEIATYGGGGYYVDLTSNQMESFGILSNLFKKTWIDRGTRAVIVDFTVYNVNVNLFCVIKLVAEIPAAGGTLVASDFRTVKLVRYVNPLDYFVLACEIILVLLIVYYIIEEILEIQKHKSAYFFQLWNVLDIVILSICILCSGFNVYRTITVQNMLSGLLANNNQHINLDQLSYWQLQFDNLTAFTIFIAMIKIFKYISFNKMMTQLMTTLDYCLKDLVGFSLMFLLLFFAFAQAGYLLFGAQLASYREFHICIYTLFRIILNDCNFKELQDIHSILGPLYFILYVFFVFFILFNMFLAILDDAYSDIKEELKDEQNEFEITEFLKEKTEKMLSKLNLKKEKIIKIQNAITNIDKNNDGKMDFDEWKEELKKRGYADAEIEALFARYDTDGDRILDEKEQLDMIKELNEQRVSLDKELIEQKMNSDNLDELQMKISTISLTRYNALCRRADLLDEIIEKLSTKFDVIVDNFQIINKTKERGKEAMKKILNNLMSMNELNEKERREKIEELVRVELNKLNQKFDPASMFTSNVTSGSTQL